MYAHTCFVTSGRASVFEPQIAANASLSFFGAKRPFFAFFWANILLAGGLHRRLAQAALFRGDLPH